MESNALSAKTGLSEKMVDYPTMNGPAIYRIRVRGYLEADLSDRLEGMHIETLTRGDGRVESVLEGRLMDQAALSGVLSTLYGLHMPVMAVDCLAGVDEEGIRA